MDNKAINLSAKARLYQTSTSVCLGQVQILAEPTSNLYDPLGYVLKSTAPNGVVPTKSPGQAGIATFYSCDASHCLVGARDARGNAVPTSWKTAVTGGHLKGLHGALQRSIALSSDALNRVQLVSGVAQ